MVTYKISTFVYFNVDYHHQEHFFVREWNDSQFQNTRGGVKVMKLWIVRQLKTFFLGNLKLLTHPSKILANTFSDSLAILKKNCPVPITLSITLMDSLPVPFPFLLKGTHTAGVMCQLTENLFETSSVRWTLQVWTSNLCADTQKFKYLRGYLRGSQRVKTERDLHWVERGLTFWIFGSNPRI